MRPDPCKAAAKAIEAMGGPTAVAVKLWGDARKQNVVSNWKVRGVPAEYAYMISRLSKVPLRELRPSMVFT